MGSSSVVYWLSGLRLGEVRQALSWRFAFELLVRVAVVVTAAALAVGLDVVVGTVRPQPHLWRSPRPTTLSGVIPDNRGALARGLSRLPVAAQGPVSAALGADDPSYRVRDGRAGLYAVNPTQRFRVSFGHSGVFVGAGRSRLALGLAAAGYGGRLHALGEVAPRAHANRVAYDRGPVAEWYANGPSGLEQGFTVVRPLPGAGGGPLTLALRVGGDLRPAPADGGRSLVFDGAHGQAVWRYGSLVASDARGRTLRASLSVRGGLVWVEVDARGARYPLRIDPLVQTAELTASDGADSDSLGTSVAISGSTIAAGAPSHQVGNNMSQGAVYVFTEPASGWQNATQTAELTTSDGADNDSLGTSVAISGSTIAAGAPGYSLGDNDGEGGVYVFAEPASGWHNATQTAELTPSDPVGSDALGTSVAISGSTIAAGAADHTVGPNAQQGAVYVFDEPASGWHDATENAELTASDGAPGDSLGDSVAISGATIAAGADSHTVGANSGQGAVYVFTEPASGWQNATQTAELTTSDGASGDGLGDSVAISGATIAAGATSHSLGGDGGQGAVYVFAEPASGWHDAIQTAELTASDGASSDALGVSVAISGSTIVAGAADHTVGPNAQQGAVYVFDEPASGWRDATENAELTTSDGATGDELGDSVAISGTTIVAGAQNHTVGGISGQGAAYAFAEPASGWQSVQTAQTALLAVTNLEQSHGRWREGKRLATFARADGARLAVGTTFSFALNQAARVTFTFTQRRTGRKVKGKCVPATKGNRDRRACGRTVTDGALSFTAQPGTSRLSFEGRISRSHKLEPGSYTLTLAATSSAGQRSTAHRLTFTILK